MPYVSIQTSKGELKFLIDTGANKNYISPAHVKVENCQSEGICKVRNINGVHEIRKFISFDLLGIKKKLKFHVFSFHKFFDGLIGYESLRDLKAKLNIVENSLKIGRKEIKMKKWFPETHKINLTEHETQFIKIPTYANGTFLIEEEKHFKNCKILPGLYKSENGVAIVEIQNETENREIEIDMNEFEINVNELENGSDYHELKKITPSPDGLKYKLRDEHLNEIEKEALLDTINNNKDVLYYDEDNLTFTHKIKHKIRTTDNIPIHTKSYKYPKAFDEIVKKEISKLLKDGIVRESISPYTSPVWVVPKKPDASGQKRFRLVIDYRKLNEKTISERYPIPEINDILDKLGRTNYFSTIDLVSGFHQIQLDEEDIEKTAFSVNSGKYEFTRMPFGLKNAPATFQRVMDCVLRELLGVCCLVYMDDIIVFSPSLEKHKSDLNKVLNKLKEANLKIQLDKCEFFRKEVQFLGHTVSEDGIRPNQDKIETIKNWPLPATEKEVRQFLGILGYYRRFVKDFAKLVKPLTSLLRKDNEIEITPEVETCFERCKQVLMRDPVLIHPDYEKEFILTTDASDFAIGAVISQGPIGKDRPVAYASRTLNRTEENYSTTEKEFLAMYWAVKQFRHYLWGKKFKLVTDHQPLTHSLTNTNRRIFRGKLELENYDYELIYKPGKNNVVADALSRIRKEEINVHDNAQSDDDIETVHSADTSDDYYLWTTEKPINAFRSQVIFKIANIETDIHEQIFPKFFRNTIVRKTFTEETIVNAFKNFFNPKGQNCIKAPISILQLIQETYRKHFSSNKIYKAFISEVLLEDVRMEDQQDDIIKNTHLFGHRGPKENKKQILQHYFFPNLDKKLKIFINSCDTCKTSKYDRKPPNLIRKSNFGQTPFEKIHIDIFFLKGSKFLTIVDSFSKFANAIPIQTRTIIDLKTAITEHIRHFGRPATIVSDQEPAFRSIDFIGFLADLGIEIHFASSSNTNGIVERFHSTLIEIYRTNKTKFNEHNLIEQINIMIDIYNNTFHDATQQKPRDLIFNTRNTTNTEEINEKFQKLQSAAKIELAKRKLKYEEKNQDNQIPVELNPNEEKYVRITQRQNKDKNPYKLAKVKNNEFLTFNDRNDIKIHKNRIRK